MCCKCLYVLFCVYFDVCSSHKLTLECLSQSRIGQSGIARFQRKQFGWVWAIVAFASPSPLIETRSLTLSSSTSTVSVPYNYDPTPTTPILTKYKNEGQQTIQAAMGVGIPTSEVHAWPWPVSASDRIPDNGTMGQASKETGNQ